MLKRRSTFSKNLVFFVAGFKNVNFEACFETVPHPSLPERMFCKRNHWALRGGNFRGWCFRVKCRLLLRDPRQSTDTWVARNG